MTPGQTRVLDYVRELIAVAELTPTYREIAARFGFSIPHAYSVVAALVASGHLELGPDKVRRIRLPGQPDLRGVPTDNLAAELARRGKTLASLEPSAPRAYGRAVTCAADTCGNTVQRGHLMCRPHWFALPPELRTRILQANSRRDRVAFERAVTQAKDLIDGGGWREAS
ncbi:LexA family protein [Sphingomonas sp.]|uniref:LexA family protein n=1 Tax=Sphingomonas sp. TaxID=28214 RepID=UPI003CC6428D